LQFDREAFVDECRRAVAEHAPQLAVREVVERVVSDPTAVEREFGVADGWRIDVLYNDEDLTIIHFVWPPLVDLFPHEHKMWSTIGIYGGVEDNTYYRRAGQSIDISGRTRGEVGDVLLLGADGIHSVRNPTRQWTAAVHVYGGDFFSHPRLQWDPETQEARPFNLENARAVLVAADTQARATGIWLRAPWNRWRQALRTRGSVGAP
jgi:predicted metal-dependent enzyme (double-stranded beta helix superfamily)